MSDPPAPHTPPPQNAAIDVTHLTSLEEWVSFPYGIYRHSFDVIQARTELLEKAMENIATKQDEILDLLKKRNDLPIKRRASAGQGTHHADNTTTKKFKNAGKVKNISVISVIHELFEITIDNYEGKMLTRTTTTSIKNSKKWWEFVVIYEDKFKGKYNETEIESMYIQVGILLSKAKEKKNGKEKKNRKEKKRRVKEREIDEEEEDDEEEVTEEEEKEGEEIEEEEEEEENEG